MSTPAILIAGGGTGGHVFPAIALAEAIQSLADVEVVFVGTARGLEAQVVPARGWRLELLEVAPVKGRDPAGVVRAAAIAARATIAAMTLVRRLAPSVVLGVGGYAAGPATLASALCRIPVALLEINAVVGLANRLVAPLARRAYVVDEHAAASFPQSARRVYGVPLRQGFAPRPPGAHDGVRVLVMGGSQGAAALNERLPDAVARVRRKVPGLAVVHQAGRGREQEVREAYARSGFDRADVVPFLDDVAAAIAGADLIVARAGAVTTAEIAAVGRAAILIPYPHAADDHQVRNADLVARAGAAVSISQEVADPVRVAAEIERLLLDHSARTAMADAARRRGKPGATRDIAIDLLAIGGIEGRRPIDAGCTQRGVC